MTRVDGRPVSTQKLYNRIDVRDRVLGLWDGFVVEMRDELPGRRPNELAIEPGEPPLRIEAVPVGKWLR